MAHTSIPTSNIRTAGLWTLRILVAAIFLLAGVMKLVGQPMMVRVFDVVGLGQWFRYLTGTLEVAGGVMVLVPTVSGLGAIVLLLVDVGAFVAQLAVLHDDWIHTVVIALLIGLLIYVQRAALKRFLPASRP